MRIIIRAAGRISPNSTTLGEQGFAFVEAPATPV
jgi:hypothetical protein